MSNWPKNFLREIGTNIVANITTAAIISMAVAVMTAIIALYKSSAATVLLTAVGLLVAITLSLATYIVWIAQRQQHIDGIHFLTRGDLQPLHAEARNARQLDVMGTALNGFVSAQSAWLIERKEAGCRIRLIVSSDSDVVCDLMFQRFHEFDRPQDHRNDLRRVLEKLRPLVGNHPSGGSLDVHVLENIPPFGLAVIDRDYSNAKVRVELYPAGVKAAERPAFELEKSEDGEWFSRFSKQFTVIWATTDAPQGTKALAKPSEDLGTLLVSRQWILIHNPKNMDSKLITFLNGGSIGLGRNENEHAWRITNDQLELLQGDGLVFSRFRFDPIETRFIHTNEQDTKSNKNQIIKLA